MDFCPKCGSRLLPQKEGKINSLVLLCPKCSYKRKLANNIIKPKIAKIIQHTPQKLVAVIGKEEQKLRTLPTVKVECPKCNHNLAYVWQVQTRSADESSTQFYRCTKCNYTFREYG